jgi:thymidylate synthase (FAD)
MNVTLTHATQHAEGLIVEMARVSNPDNAKNSETAPKLLRYLIKHKHWSPFEMAGMCLKIETERDIAAQIIRHKSFSYQEYSLRYAKTSPAEIINVRRQDIQNRQNSIDDFSDDVKEWAAAKTAVVIANSYLVYEELLELGVAKECARRVLPLCTPTTLYMHGNLRSWIHYIDLRTEKGTQLEHRDIANKCKEIFTKEFPTIAHAAFEG